MEKDTPLSVVVKEVLCDVKEQWDKAEIPHNTLEGRKGEKDITTLLLWIQSLAKVPVDRRGQDFSEELDTLYDAAICRHSEPGPCSCPVEHQVYLWYYPHHHSHPFLGSLYLENILG